MLNNAEMPSGIILVDKKAGVTSMATDNYIKKLFGTRKVGHSGTLDPFATGLLPIFTGRALRFMRYTDGYDKAYSCLIRFGASTDTMDRCGEIVGGREPSTEELNELVASDFRRIRDAFAEVAGRTVQQPPAYSAKKINGRKAYELARQGEAVELPAVPIRIYSLTVNRIFMDGGSLLADFDVECSKGTYIRKICDDVGALAGFGAHAVELRRTRCGMFSVEDALTEDQLADKVSSGDFSFILRGDEALRDMPAVRLSRKQFENVRLGRKIPAIDGTQPEVRYAAWYEDLVAAVLYRASEDGRDIMRIERMLFADE